MPSNYAHITFAKKVLPQLDVALQHRIQGEMAEYQVGSLGPDLLFFHPPVFMSRIAKIGSDMHNRPARDALERLRPLVLSGAPYAASYAAGFICHFVLDNACHPFVNDMAKQAKVSHLGLEVELDRYIAELEGKNPLKFKPLNSINPNQRLFCTLKGLYPLNEKQIKSCYKDIRSTGGMLISLGGSIVEPAFSLVPAIRGTIMKKQPRENCLAPCGSLYRILENSVSAAAFLVGSYMISVRANSPLDPAFGGTFSGKK